MGNRPRSLNFMARDPSRAAPRAGWSRPSIGPVGARQLAPGNLRAERTCLISHRLKGSVLTGTKRPPRPCGAKSRLCKRQTGRYWQATVRRLSRLPTLGLPPRRFGSPSRSGSGENSPPPLLEPRAKPRGHLFYVHEFDPDPEPDRDAHRLAVAAPGSGKVNRVDGREGRFQPTARVGSVRPPRLGRDANTQPILPKSCFTLGPLLAVTRTDYTWQRR